MHTGDGDISKIGEVELWDYRDHTDFFEGTCGMVNGSAGEFYPPNQTKDKPVSFFSPDMCRTINFDFAEEVNVNGINGYKYSGSKKTVDDGSMYPENKCFNSGQSIPSGVMNVTSCRFGTPVFMSFPHYYQADKYYLDQVEGLNPTKEDHEFHIVLEPMTGIPLDVAARFQINMLIRPIPNIALYQDAPTMFFPVLWFEQKVAITDEMAADVRTVLSIPTTGYICAGIMFAIGFIMVLWLPVARYIGHKRKHAIDEKSDNMQPEKAEKVSPEVSPLLNKNGNLKNVEICSLKSSADNGVTKVPPPVTDKTNNV